MNFEYLMQYISKNLHTSVRAFNRVGECLATVCMRTDLPKSAVSLRAPALSELLAAADDEYPVLLADSLGVAYAVIRTDAQQFIIGPVLLTFGAACKRKLTDAGFEKEELMSLHQCSSADLLRDALLLHNLFHERTVITEDAADANCLDEEIKFTIQERFVEIIFHNQEHGSRHNPYDQEVREVTSIREGNLTQLKKSWAEDYIGKLGVVAKTPLRNHQNLGIILVTLASRAAIEGGVMPEIAYSLSDSYINKIEEAHSPEEALSLGRQAEYQYASLVQEIKAGISSAETIRTSDSRISLCKDYIFSHLHEKISVSDIAKELYLNANYLSDLFRRAEGITISEYIMREKIKLAKNMLIYSRYSYNEIASYLGFSSQSHLGARFKKHTGMTLHQYREKYGRREFDRA